MPGGPSLEYGAMRFSLHRRCTRVGRRSGADAPDIDLAPLDRDRVVSRRHAELVADGLHVSVVDVEARNGVFVNLRRLAPRESCVLKDEDQVSFGGVSLTFRAQTDWPDGLSAEWDFDEGLERDTTQAASDTLLGQLNQAVGGNQFILNYQPKIDLRTNRLVAVESLVRWQHPTQGRLFPDAFLELAELTGHVKFITSFVLEESLRQQALWRSKGLKLNVSVNISAKDLEDDGLAQRVADLLAKTDTAPGNLCVELTETGVMSKPERALKNMRELKAVGVKISIDDFGVGQSSLAYLKQLPADELKVDKSFVMSLDDKNLAILKSAVTVGHDLGMTVCAEGVESKTAVKRLKKLGCDLGQGYYFGRPVAPDALLTTPLAKVLLDEDEDATHAR